MRAHGQTESTPLKGEREMSPALVWARLLTSVTSIAEGYDVGCLSGVLVILEDKIGLTKGQVSVLAGLAAVGVTIGAPVGGGVADHFGRRQGIALSYMFLILGSLMMANSASFEQLIVGRIVQSAGIGAGLGVVTTYMGEVAPSAHRGKFPSLEEVFIVVGFTLGYIADYFLRDGSWRVILGLGAILPTFCLLFLLSGWLPESPRWLATKGRLAEAEAILCELAGPEEVHGALRRWKEEAHADTATWSEVLCPRSASQRRQVIAGVGVAMTALASGIGVVGMYLTSILSDQMDDKRAFGSVVLVGLCRVVVCATSCFHLLDRMGRRALLLTSTAGTTAASGFLALAYGLQLPAMPWQLLGFFLFALFHSIGLGPVHYVFASEIFDNRLRSKGVALAMSASRSYGGILLTAFPWLIVWTGLRSFFMFLLIMNFASFLFILYFVPETAGTQLEDMETLFESI